MDPSITIECQNCGTTFELATQAADDLPDEDLGKVECQMCGASWCHCGAHGRYECPPPCPECPHRHDAVSSSGARRGY